MCKDSRICQQHWHGLTRQAKGKELEYRIIAVNKADKGEPSKYRNGRSVTMAFLT